MRSYKGIGLVFLTLCNTTFAQPADESFRVLIKKKPQADLVFNSEKQLGKALNLPVKAFTPVAGGSYSVVIDKTVNQHSIDSVLRQLRKNPLISDAAEDRVGHFKPMDNATSMQTNINLSHDMQWDEFKRPAGIMLESAPNLRDGAWALTTGRATKPVVVAVLDTGIALNAGLVNNLVKNQNGEIWGWNFSSNNPDIIDETGTWHGTHVAGTIAGFSQVMIGVGEQLQILPVKIPDKTGMFYESQVINAIYWSVGGDMPGVPHNSYPAKVLNMSFGVDERPGKEIDICDSFLQDAINFAREKGAVVMVAAGNDNRYDHYNAPAVCNHTMIVASTGPEGLRAYYSNYGSRVNFAAPGGDLTYGKLGGILSTVSPESGYQNSGFDFFQGTSMATPHASGVAGLLYAVTDNTITPEEVEQIMIATAHPFGTTNDPNKSCVGRKTCGSGIIDAENAVKAALEEKGIK